MRNENEKKHGTINWDGKKLVLTQAAYADNYNGGVGYYAHATFGGCEYKIRWDTTQAHDDACELARLMSLGERDLEEADRARVVELERMVGTIDAGDESAACDWDNPAEVWML